MNKVGLTAGVVAVFVILTSAFAADDTITLPAGSELHVQLTTSLNSKTNDSGDLWEAKVVEPVFAKGEEVVLAGSTVEGHITYVAGTERGKSKGEMQLVAESISTPDSSKYTILPSSGSSQGAGTKNQAGSLQGAGKNATGTAVDTGVDADARTFMPKKKGKEIELPQGTEITFLISHDTVATKVPPASSTN